MLVPDADVPQPRQAQPRQAPPRPPSEVAPPPDEDHYRMVAGNAGNLVVFLGSGANADEQAEPWSKGSGRLPDDRELATYLASHAGLQNAPPDLAEVAQYAGATYGEMELFQWVTQVLRVELVGADDLDLGALAVDRRESGEPPTDAPPAAGYEGESDPAATSIGSGRRDWFSSSEFLGKGLGRAPGLLI